MIGLVNVEPWGSETYSRCEVVLRCAPVEARKGNQHLLSLPAEVVSAGVRCSLLVACIGNHHQEIDQPDKLMRLF
jgi:hypothetical protein